MSKNEFVGLLLLIAVSYLPIFYVLNRRIQKLEDKINDIVDKMK